MKHVNSADVQEMENIVSLCCGIPQGDELPQVAGVEDILVDVYSDMLNVPREIAAGHFHHQCADEEPYDSFNAIH